LICNRAGLQVRPMIQFEEDVACALANARFNALVSVIGAIDRNIEAILEELGPERSSYAMQGKMLTRRCTQLEAWSQAVIKSGIDTKAPIDATPKSNGSVSMEKSMDEMWKFLHNGSWRELLNGKEYITGGRFEVQAKGDHKHCHPSLVLKEVSSRLGPDDVICVDTGDITLWTSLCLSLTKGQRTLSSERLGTMGYSICAGIAATLLRKEAGRGVVLVGDGAAQMALGELGTVKQIFASAPKHQHKLLVIIFDNELWGRVIFGFDGALGCDLGPSPDFVALAKAYGGDGALLSDPVKLPMVMDRAFASDGLFLIHALVDHNVKADMSTFHDSSTQMMNSG